MKKLLFVLGIIVVAVIASFFVFYDKKQIVSLTFKQPGQGINASVYKITAESDGSNLESLIGQKNLVKQASSDETFSLAEGTYAVQTGGNQDYKVEISRLIVGELPQTVEIDVSYTDEKLSSLLDEEKEAVRQTILSTVPNIKDYSLSRGKLYGSGEWYGTTIIKAASKAELRSSYHDIFRVIANKQNGIWSVITLPPDLILSAKSYPNVPKDILVDVNKLTPDY